MPGLVFIWSAMVYFMLFFLHYRYVLLSLENLPDSFESLDDLNKTKNMKSLAFSGIVFISKISFV